MEREGSIFVNNDNRFLSIPLTWTQEPMICQVFGIIIYIGVYGAFPHMFQRMPPTKIWKLYVLLCAYFKNRGTVYIDSARCYITHYYTNTILTCYIFEAVL